MTFRFTKNTDGFAINRVYDSPLSNVNVSITTASVTDEDTLYITLLY